MKKILSTSLLCFIIGVTGLCQHNPQSVNDRGKKVVLYDDWPVTVESNANRNESSGDISVYFVPIGTTWDHRIITYFFQNGTADIEENNEQQAIRDAFALWSAQTDLYFLEVCAADDADIVFLWATFNHGDAGPFDGQGGVLAHTLGGPPPNDFGDQAGDMHFDDSETWTLDTRPNNAQPIDLVTVAAHEIGHALGLDHTSVSGSLMLANYTGSHRFLGSDDIAGIRSLYGQPQANIPVTGPGIICTSGTFTLQDQPAGTNVNWSSSNPNGLAINAITGDATRQNNFNGKVTLTATINSVCGEVDVTRVVNVGNYLPIGTSSYNSNCSGNTFNVLNTSLSAACTANTPIYFSYAITDPNYSNFVFTPVSVPSGASWSSSGGNLYMTVYTPPSQGTRSATIELSATGPCGPYSVNFTSTAVNYYSSPFSISPNPSTEIVTVSMDNDNLSDNPSQNLIYGVTITDLYGTPGESFDYKAGINSVNISLQDFNPGIYILSVFDGKMWRSQRLIIQK